MQHNPFFWQRRSFYVQVSPWSPRATPLHSRRQWRSLLRLASSLQSTLWLQLCCFLAASILLALLQHPWHHEDALPSNVTGNVIRPGSGISVGPLRCSLLYALRSSEYLFCKTSEPKKRHAARGLGMGAAAPSCSMQLVGRRAEDG